MGAPVAGPLPERVNPDRLTWAVTRSVLETDRFKHLKYSIKRRRHWSLFEALVQLFGWGLRMTPFYARGYRNAAGIVLNRVDLTFPDLPRAFHGYEILHLTDLHLDFMPDTAARILDRVADLAVDLCVMTGDYREKTTGGFKAIIEPMARIAAAVRARDGILATLGNHDTQRMVRYFEQAGIPVLANETRTIARRDAVIRIVGIDDPEYYYTDQAVEALEQAPEGFRIALVHSPSLYDIAAENGVRLYLCGHTHAGQICLPGGRPVILHLRHGRRFYRGLWHFRGMTGYTGQGTGTVGLPVRFFTESEITCLRLLRAAP